MPAPRRPLALLLLAALLAGQPAAAEDAPPGAPTELESAFRDLASSLATTRRAAVQRLVDGLPASRPAVIRALAASSEAVKVHLVEVLARDGSAEALAALLDQLRRGSDFLVLEIQDVLLADADATRRVLEAWAADPGLREDATGRISRRVRDLEALLRRAEAERRFLAHKSASGYTGSYRDQYADLQPFRAEALDLLVGILSDRAVPAPGRVTTGGFEFLTASGERIEFDEVQSMAATAFIELARPDDDEHLMQLDALLDSLNRHSLSEGGRYDDILLALALVRGREDDEMRLRRRLLELKTLTRSHARYAVLLLRLGRYEEAIAAYLTALRIGSEPLSRAGAHYNIACAYARWAEGFEGAGRDMRRRKALEHLELAVDAQWSDIAWMEQDRDLDLVRDLPGYQELLERIRREVTPPERGPRPGR